MALPSGSPLNEILTQARQRWTITKRTCERIRDQSAASPIAGNVVLGLLDNLKEDLAYFQVIATTPGLGDYASAQYADVGYDIGADFNAFMVELQNVIDWIIANIPKADPDGVDGPEYLLLQSLDAAGNRTNRMFSSAQTAGLRTVLDALIATVE